MKTCVTTRVARRHFSSTSRPLLKRLVLALAIGLAPLTAGAISMSLNVH